jgi:hypothetical protein
MKLKLEFGQYEIEIEEKDGSVVVKAEKDEEIVEEFTLLLEEGSESEEDFEGEEGEELMPFDSQEEEDFEGEDMEEMEDDMEEMDDEEEAPEGGEMKLESFQSFISKRK